VVDAVATVVAIDVGGEVLLVDEPTGRLQLLNASGGIVWSCLDSASTIAEICQDLAAVTGAPLEDVTADTIDVVDRLVAIGMVRPAGTGDPARPEPPRGHPHADDRVPQVTLHLEDDDGRTLRTHTLSVDGRAVLHTHDADRARAAAAAHGATVEPAGTRLDARAFVSDGDGDALLVLAREPSLLDLPERQVARLGWRPVDVPVRLDRETLALALADGSRTPVRAVVVLGYEPNLVGEMSMGHRVLMTSWAVARRGRLAADDVRVLARLMATTPFVWVVGYDPSDVVRAIGRLDRELPGAPAVSPVPSS
jgi:hypothetical protein